MQADVILKDPLLWVPPVSLLGGARVGGGARPPPRTRLQSINQDLPRAPSLS